MVDDSVGDALGFFEVKRWVSEASTPGDVGDQLDCYVDKADSRGFRLVRDGRLNVLKNWTEAYSDNSGSLWCAWADRFAAGRPGNIYFGRYDELAVEPH